MAKQGKTFDPNLKRAAVRMIKDQGLSVQNVSESMDTESTAIRRSLTRYGEEQSGHPGIGRSLAAEEQHIRQREQENRQRKGDVDLLKKLRPSCPRTEMIYQVVRGFQKKAVSVTHSCVSCQ
ncbi:transposase [Actimicrobium antarcticum]|uniref:Transposase n=1 Tax=Actimicrobium antarcticum TaxID=1051899 RepID=A0ABP7U130_9BURK